MSESESDAFGDFCDALQEKYNMDHEDREKLVELYKNQEGLMSKRDAFCASAATTIAVVQKLHSTLGPAIRELRDKVKATPETKPEEAVDTVGYIVEANIRAVITAIVSDAQGSEL